jgi:hypothetical protein
MFVCMCDFISDCRKKVVIPVTYYTSHVIRIIVDIQFVTFNLLLKHQFVVLNKKLLSLFGVRSERDLEQNILDNTCQASTDYSRNVPESIDTHLQTRLGTFCSGCDWYRKLVSKGPTITEKGRFRISDFKPESGLHMLQINHNEMCQHCEAGRFYVCSVYFIWTS